MIIRNRDDDMTNSFFLAFWNDCHWIELLLEVAAKGLVPNVTRTVKRTSQPPCDNMAARLPEILAIFIPQFKQDYQWTRNRECYDIFSAVQSTEILNFPEITANQAPVNGVSLKIYSEL